VHATSTSATRERRECVTIVIRESYTLGRSAAVAQLRKLVRTVTLRLAAEFLLRSEGGIR